MYQGSLFCSFLDSRVVETVEVENFLEQTPLLFNIDLGFSFSSRFYLNSLGGLDRSSNSSENEIDDFLEHILSKNLILSSEVLR